MESKKLYYKINEKDSELTEKLLNENNIVFTRYSDPLKAICDEETERMRQEYIDIELTEEQSQELSDCLFETEMDLLNYDIFLELTDRYIENVKDKGTI